MHVNLALVPFCYKKQECGSFKPICYFSRRTTKDEQKFHSYELETIAIVQSMKQFRHYLIGLRFKVVADCNAIRSTMMKRDLIPKVGRWWLLTQEFDFTVEYRPGIKMAHVDALSRNAVEDAEDSELILSIGNDENDWILTAQLNDDYCKNLHEVLTKIPADLDYKRIHKGFILKNNRVFRKTSDGERWVVPKTARSQVVFYHHDNLGHFALDKTLELIRTKYWFPKMRKYLKRYIACCLSCLYNKEASGKRPGYLHSIKKHDVPMYTVHIHHLGPFVKKVLNKIRI